MNLFGYGVVGISLGDGSITTDALWLDGRVALIVVDIQTTLAGGHDDAVAGVGSYDTAVVASPRHDDGALVEVAAFENLVPTDDALTILVEVFLHFANYVALQFSFFGASRFIFVSELLNLLLTERTGLPFIAGSFVATDVEQL